MSIEIGILKGEKDLQVTRFYGGKKKGNCVQLTREMEEGRTGYVQLSADELRVIIPILTKYIVDETTPKETISFEFDEEVKDM